ncbi:NAD(P)H-quinone oxidoreductase chain 4 1 [Streptomyces hundungensis]|uniref:NAD(P)H-quinone oxidoreductase chain 4 1 n=1 Tax=Streptomyces hundungensis TaxID=1077946 RepID=A0A387H6P1_9ACTN|nr:NAD(P)H-quinone oxidoreductase chain 4 1 [Streptomyces hundungensis]
MPAPDAERALVVLGTLTALVGAVMCWQQRHIKRFLAFSTVAHTGLFLVGIGLLKPEATGGVALYALGHAGVKAALFACTGILLDRYGSVDEHELHGRARELRAVAVLYVVGAAALAGLPPFGTGLGKSVTEEAGGVGFAVLFVAVSAVTGGAVLRVAARVFFGLGPRPLDERGCETEGEDEEPETQGWIGRVPATMVAVPALLLAGSLTAGMVPGLGTAVGRAFGVEPDHMPQWTPLGALLGLASAALGAGLSAASVRAPAHREPRPWTEPLRRLHSGHIGDYVAWLLMGTALLGALALPGVLTG